MKTAVIFPVIVCSLSLGVLPAVSAQTFTFTTLAGAASVGSADGPGAGARFSGPASVAADNQGNVYVADEGNDTVRRIAPGGVVSTIAGRAGVAGYLDGVGTNALFTTPRSLALDANNILYLVDNGMIRKLTPTGTNWVVSTLAGQAGIQGYSDATGTNAQFCTPSGVAVDGAGNVYVADQCNDVIRKITPGGVVSTIAGQPHHPGSADGTNNSAQFYFPFNLSVDAATNLYVTDSVNQTIRKLAPAGTNWVVTTLAGQVLITGPADGTGTNAQFNGPSGIAVDAATNVYVADNNNQTIRRLTSLGTNWRVSTFAGLAGIYGHADGLSNSARFYSPNGVGVDGSGNVYVADAGNNTIRKITPNGLVSTVAGVSAGSTDGPGTSARFWSTQGLVLDPQGNLYAADYYNATIRKITTNGDVSTIAGQAGNLGSADGTNGSAQFYYPYNLAGDSQSNIYVTDVYNSTIRKLTPVGTNWVVTTIAGQAGVYGIVDGLGTNAVFYVPDGIAADNNGNLFVADDYGHTIRRLAWVGTNWLVTTIAGRPFTHGYADGIGTNAMFYFPHALVVDSATNVYVADMENNAIRKLTQAGTNWTVTTLAGQPAVRGSADGTGTNAQFYFPAGLALDGNGNLYVADTYNQTIRKMTPAGTNWIVSTVAGRVGIQGSTDGIGTNALFNYLYGVAVDGAGNLYVADTYNSTIRLGVLASPAPPLLQINPANADQMIVSWPLSAADFVLETSGTASFGAAWAPATNGVAIVGREFARTDTLGSTNTFYRLRRY